MKWDTQDPPHFRPFALTDRGTGEVWVLMSDPDTERLKIVSPPPSGFQGRIHPPYGGPRVGYDPDEIRSVRLFVRDGRLGFDDPPSRVSTRPVLAPNRMRGSRHAVFYRIVSPEGFNPDTSVLAYRVWSAE